MKISIQSQAKDLYERSVTIEISDDINMREMAEAFAGACVAYGFLPDSVKEYVYSEMLDGTFKGDEAHDGLDKNL
jgi:hypothetical protein